MRWSKRAKQSIAIALTFALAFTMNVPLGAWATYAGPSSETTSPETSTAPTAAQTFEALVAALPEAEAVTADDADAVAAAQGAYDALSEADKALVAESFAKLEAVEAALAALSAPAPLEEGSPDPGTTPSAGTNAAAWDGTVGTGFAGGDGTADDPYQIADAAQLAYLAQRVNAGTSYSGQYFKLTADIDLNNKAWTPIGIGSRNPTTEDPSTAYFEGIFDGGGRSISNLGVEYNLDNHGAGLFGTVKNAVIKNVNVVSGTVSNTVDSAAGVVAVLLGDSGQVIDCSNGATVTGNSVGGVVARAYATSNTVSGCSNSGAITGTVKAGGVACITGGTATEIKGCSNTGKVTGGSFGLGGVLGYGAAGVTVSDCRNEGTIGESNYRYAGGIVGYATGSGSKVLNGTNTGAIAASECSGGIVGIVTGSWGVEGSSNEGEISKADKAGGIVGSNQSGLIASSKNTGSVSGSYAGGVAGSLGTGGTVEGCAGGASSVAGTVAAGRLMGAIANGPNDEQSAFLSIDDANGDSYEGLGTVGIMGPHTGWGYLTVKSGTFRGEPPVGQGDGVLVFPSSGSLWEDKPDVAGIWRRNVGPSFNWEKETNYVAETGGVGYATLAKAITAAEAGGTVTLLANTTVDATVEIAAEKDIALDLNGCVLTSGVAIPTVSIKGKLAVKDSSASGQGMIENTKSEKNYQGFVAVEVAGGENLSPQLSISSGKISGTVKVAGNRAYGAERQAYPAKVSVSDRALISVSEKDDYHGPAVALFGSGAELDMTGGQIVSETYHAAIQGNGTVDATNGIDDGGTTINISGGTVKGPLAVYHPQSGTMTVTGGTLEGDTGIEMRAGTLDVSGDAVIKGTLEEFRAWYHGSGSTTEGAGIAVSQHTTELPIKVNIAGGTISGNKALYEGIVQDTKKDPITAHVTLSVTGGTFNTIGANGVAVESQNCKNFITGGTFSSDVAAYVAQDYAAIANGDGTYTVAAKEAAIGDVKYATLEDAFAAANAAEAPTGIKLLSNAEVTQSITLKNTKLVTLDLNGYTADFSGSEKQLFVQGVSLAIDDTSTAKTGTIKGNKLSLVSVTDGGKLNLVNGKIENAKNRAVSLEGSEFVMDGGFIVTPGAGVYFVSGKDIGNGTFTMNDGAIIVGSSGEGVRITKGVFTMNGGSIESQGRAAVNSISSSTITINSGALSASTAVVNVGANCSTEVLGGTISATDESGTAVYLSAATSSFVAGKEGTTTSLTLKFIEASKVNTTVKLYQGVVVGSLKSTSGPVAPESVLDCNFESDVTDALPVGYVCEKQASSGYYTVAPFEQNDPRAVATITRGGTTTQCASIKAAVLALQDGDTLTLMKDVVRTSEFDSSGLITVRASNVTIDLNGCKIENGSATIGYGLYVQCPGDSTFALKNSGSAKGVISGPSALFADSSDSKLLQVDLGENIELVSTNSERPVVALGDARIPHNTANEALATNGGYKAKDANDGKDYIYGSLALAVARSAENDKTAYLLNDCTSATSIVASGTAILDLQGHTFTTSSKVAIKPSKTGTNLTVKNGKVVSTSSANEATGVGCTDTSVKDFVLTLDGVEVTMQNGDYAAYVNGNVSGATLNLLNSTLTTDANSVGVYFPCLTNGKLNIENTSITAGTGIGIKGGTVSIAGDKTVVNAAGAKVVPSAPGLNSGINDTGDAVYLEGNYETTASVSISGGTFKSAHGNAVQMLFNPEGPAYAKTISITGGTFSSDPATYCARGFGSVKNADGTYRVVDKREAAIGDTKYLTVAEAFSAAADGETITLLTDVTVNDGIEFNKPGATVGLNVNGKTYTVTEGANINNRGFKITAGTLRVLGGGVMVAEGSGTTSSNGAGAYGMFRVEKDGALFMSDVTLKNSRPYGLNVKVLGGTAELENVVIESRYGGGIEVTEAVLGEHSQAGSALVKNCEFTQTGYADHTSSALSVSGGSSLTVDGGTYESEGVALYAFSSGGVITVKGGSFTGAKSVVRAEVDTATYPAYTGSVKLEGGTFSGPLTITSPASLQVTGGSFDTVLDKAYYDEDIYSQNALDASDAPGAVVPRVYPVAYDLAGGSLPDSAANPATYTYFDDALTLANPVKAGYAFAGWTGTGLSGPSMTVTIASGSTGDRSYQATWTANANTAYTVEHHFQNVEGDGYTVDNRKTQTLTGTTDTDTAATALAVTGFTPGAVVQQTIAGDGSTVVVIRYDRNVHEVSYAFEGTVPSGASRLPAAHQVRYGAPVVAADAATAPGYDFSGWGVTAGLAMPDEDLVLSGSFTARGDTAYRVEHYQQGLDGAYALAATDSLTGETDTTATATPKAYPGFSLNDGAPGTVTQGAIAGDGSLVLKLYYDRNAYQVSYAYTGAVPAGAPAAPAAASVKFGQTVRTADAPVLAGYAFSGWSRTGSFAMPAENVSITGSWTPRTDTAYTVKHYFQNIEDDGYTVDDARTQSLAGTTGADTAAAPLAVTGFTARAVEQRTIAADGSTVVEVRYDRNVHTVSYQYRGTVPPGASALPDPASYRYGAAISVAPAATAPGHTFAGWSEADKLTMGDADIVLFGSFTARGDTAYRVEHYQQGLDGAYALAATDGLTGETGAEATAVPKTFAGFSLNEGAPGTVTQGAIAGDGSLVLKLYYDRNAYQVSYAYTGAVPAGAPAAPAAASVKFGQQVEPAAAPAMTGYAFSGWSRAEAFAMPAENVVVTGSWTPNADVSYTVRYLLDGTATKLADDKVVEGRTFGETYTEQAPAIAGYTVKGQPAQSITLDAYGKELVFPYTANEARIVFDSNGGPDIPDLVGKTGEIVEGSLPAPERAAHAFVGWYAEKSLINQVTALPATFPAGTTTYVAKWNAVPLPPETTGNVEIQVEVPAPPDNGDARATVTDEALKAAAKHAEGALEDLENGEVPTGMSAEDAEDLADLVSGADKADVKVVVSLGFQQMSEEEVADGEKGAIGDVAADGETATLYLDLSVKMVVRVEKDGSVVEREVPLDEVDEPLLFEIHVDPALLQAKTVRIAHVHEGKTEIIVPESVDRVRGIIRLYVKEFSTYALLTSATCVVSFDVGGGSAIDPQTVAFGQAVRKPADPTRAGFSFAGWFADAACTEPYDFAAPVEQPFALYAKWAAVDPGPGPSPGPGPDPDPGAPPKPEGGDAQGFVPLDTTSKGSSAGRSVGTGDGTGVLMASLAGIAALAAVCALAAALRRRRSR